MKISLMIAALAGAALSVYAVWLSSSTVAMHSPLPQRVIHVGLSVL